MKNAWKQLFATMRDALASRDAGYFRSTRKRSLSIILDELIDFADTEEFERMINEFSDRNNAGGKPTVNGSILLSVFRSELLFVQRQWFEGYEENSNVPKKDSRRNYKPFCIAIGSIKDLFKLPNWAENSLILLDEIFQLLDARK